MGEANSIQAIKSRIKENVYRLVPVSKNGKKLTSDVWNIFCHIEDDNENILQGLLCCKICKTVLSHSIKNGTSNLSKHKCTKLHKRDENGKKQNLVSNYFMAPKDIRSKITENVVNEVKMSAMAFNVLDMRPMYALLGDGLKKLLSVFYLYRI